MTPDWIAIDWGTSNLRAWAMASDGAVLARAESADGMGKLDPTDFAPALRRLIAPWLSAGNRMDVIAAGMVGARQGWVEAAYRAVPCPPLDPAAAIVVPETGSNLSVRILPGLSQQAPFDVMRGEETQVAGLLLEEPEFKGDICLPGTHSKWVRVAGGAVTQFTSCMTGEIFALLSEQSVLRHSVGDDLDDDAFGEAVSEGFAEASSLIGRLFSVRAGDLLAGRNSAEGRGRLSGLLIGAEIAAATKGRGDGPVALIGADRLVDRYETALGLIGLTTRRYGAEDMILNGLRAARAALMRG